MPITSSLFSRRRGSRLGSVALVTLALAGLTTACGGSTKVVSGPSTTATTVKSQAAFVSCLEKQGIPASAATQLGTRPRGGGPGGSAPAGSPSSGGAAAGSGGATRPSLPAGVTQAQLRSAEQACRSVLPAGSGFGGGGRFTSPALAAYRNCLQLHGVTLPTPGSRTSTTTAAGSATTASSSTTTSSTTPGTAGPGPAGPGNGGPGLGGLDTSNPTVQAALTACAALRPAPGGTTTSSTTAASS